MYNNKFDIGRKVRIGGDEYTGIDFIVTAIIEEDAHNMFKNPGTVEFGTDFRYRYQLKAINEAEEKVVYAGEDIIEEIPYTEQELQAIKFAESVAMVRTSNVADPAFKVGDVVRINGNNSDRRFIVKAIVEGNISSHAYCYDLIPMDNDDQLMRFTEDALAFEYHDVAYEYEYRGLG